MHADVLKVGHHGSHSSTAEPFLAAVSPSYAVICVGAGNVYGHPHQVILDRLTAAGTAIYRTDYHGHVVFASDGTTIATELAPWTAGSGAPPVASDPVPELLYVGSRISDKYHYPSCRFAGQIAPENAIWFESAQEAADTGYVPCGTCKPPR